MNDICILDSITDADAADRGAVVASGSHGGIYPAAVASQAGIRAVAFNDAGRGLEDAGIEGVLKLGEVGMAAIAADCMTAPIGDANALLSKGVVSVVNAVAEELGIAPGQDVQSAMVVLKNAPQPTSLLAKVAEARRRATLENGLEVELLDSASLVGHEDIGRIVVTGSHGALIGGDPSRALKAQARIAVYNDAGGGIGGTGYTRLPALESAGIAAVTVAASSAKIGNARSALQTGIISAMNAPAGDLGAKKDLRLKTWLARLDS
ncbi:MAG: hypothetical protein AAGJ28_07050 [Pseudomonadota bacterium]